MLKELLCFKRLAGGLLVLGFLGCLWQAPQSVQATSYMSAKESYYQGILAYRNGQYAQAIVYLKEASNWDAKNPNIRYYMAISFDKLGRTQDAANAYRFVVDNGPRYGTDPAVLAYAKQRLLASATTPANATAIKQQEKLSALSSAATYRADTLSASGSLSRAVTRSVVKIQNESSALMIDASLNNRVSGHFVLDTGATYTSISREMAEALGYDLTNADSILITTANGRIRVPKVVVKTISVNGLEAHNVEVTVIDVRKGSPFSGLLGLSFIKNFRLTIDPENEQVIFQAI